MKKEIMERWVKALRSGDYKQTAGALKDNEGFCCLGVLCDIKGGEWKKEKISPNYFLFEGNVSSLLPGSVRDWAGMVSRTGSLSEEHDDNLVEMNDTGDTFEEIADIIEKHWEDL